MSQGEKYAKSRENFRNIEQHPHSDRMSATIGESGSYLAAYPADVKQLPAIHYPMQANQMSRDDPAAMNKGNANAYSSNSASVGSIHESSVVTQGTCMNFGFDLP